MTSFKRISSDLTERELLSQLIQARTEGYSHAIVVPDCADLNNTAMQRLLHVAQTYPDNLILGTNSQRVSRLFMLLTGVISRGAYSRYCIYPLHKMPFVKAVVATDASLALRMHCVWANMNINEVRNEYFEDKHQISHCSPFNILRALEALLYGLPRRWWRTAIYGPFFLIVCLLFQIYTLFFRLFGGTRSAYTRSFTICARLLIHTATGFRFKTKGTYNTEEAKVIIANHTSVFDILAIVSRYKKLIILTQDWVQNNFFFAITVRTAGFVPITKGICYIMDELRKRAEDGYSILVFPEGHRSRDGYITRFHQGAFHIARELNLPVQPILLRNAYNVMHAGQIHIGNSGITMCLLPIMHPPYDLMPRKLGQKTQHYYEQLITDDYVSDNSDC